MSVILESKNLSFQNLLVYNDITVNSKEITFLSGPSGCGKSTFFKMLNATVNYSTGDIYYKGENIKNIDSTTLRRKVLLVGQSVFLFDTSIRENFYKYCEFRDEKKPSDEAIKKYLKICCADFDLDKSCSTLSGGEKQRVYTAIFLSFMPEMLLLDEPTSALDYETGLKVLQNIIDFCKESGIELMVVSHDKTLTDKLADRVIQIGRGEANE